MARLQRMLFRVSILSLIVACNPVAVLSADLDGSSDILWPRKIEIPEGTILIYQPQIEKFQGTTLESRFAASIQTADMTEPLFGAVWTKAHVETDRDARRVNRVSLETVQSRFPNATPEQTGAFARILKEHVPQWNLLMSLDGLLAGLDAAEQRQNVEAGLENKPPNIIYVQHPAILGILDGKPILQPVDNSPLTAVINTPFPMVFHKAEKAYYLMGNDTWYKATDVTGNQGGDG
jgi:hypothetical protein